MPGGFGEEDDDEEEENDETSRRKRPRVDSNNESAGVAQVKTKTISIVTPTLDHDEDNGKEAERKQKEREAIKRKLDMNKARRRSSMGRVSVGGGKAPLIPNRSSSLSFFPNEICSSFCRENPIWISLIGQVHSTKCVEQKRQTSGIYRSPGQTSSESIH
jgi:hypothetical protein